MPPYAHLLSVQLYQTVGSCDSTHRELKLPKTEPAKSGAVPLPSRTVIKQAQFLVLKSHQLSYYAPALFGVLLHALGYSARCILIQCSYCIKLLMFRKS